MSGEVHISVVSPVYKGEKMVAELVRRIKDNVSPITESYEIILVNDASPDNSWEEIKKECAADTRVKGIDLSRNFGQHYAITAGLNFVKGEWVVVMDCDLQDRPEEIPNIYNKAQEGWDIVYASRVYRHDSYWKKLSSKLFHAAYKFVSGIDKDRSIANFGIFHSNVIKEYNKSTEYFRSFSTIIKQLGFKKTSIPVAHSERLEGKSSYSLMKLFRLSFDIIVASTNRPLVLMIAVGFIMSFVSFLIALLAIILQLSGVFQVPGYASTILSIWFVGGLNILMLGIVAVYVGKIFDQVKGRPLYIVQSVQNIE